MSRYTLEPLNASDIPRCAVIQREAFKEDPFALAALGDVPDEGHIAWFQSLLETDSTPPGYRHEVKIARDLETGEIVGWAKWWIPVNEDHQNSESSPNLTPPSAMKHEIWHDFFSENDAIEKEIMGNRKHWDLVILVVDPAWQRRGIGKALVQEGIQRAQKDGLPIFLSGTPKGVPLYKSLGFEIKAIRELTDAKIVATFFEKSPV